jgi:hypothetical protein
MAKVSDLKFEFIPLAPYLPNTATSDYFLFPMWMKLVVKDLPTIKSGVST